MQNNLVSIIIPTYNRGDLITETLDSIINQTHSNWECIIVDDGSSDNTAEVLRRYIQNDIRFQYHQRPIDKQKGANACRNYGFELSKGKYVKWFDSDDIMHPDFLAKQVQVLSDQPELDFCASFSETFIGIIDNVVAFNNPEVYIDDQNTLFNYIIGKLIFLTPSPLWRKSFLNGKNLFDETLFNAHETDFNFSRLVEGARFKYLKEMLFFVRRGHVSIDSKSFNINSFSSMLKYYQKVFLYLISPSSVLRNEERKLLSKFVLYKQLMILHNARFMSVFCLRKEKFTVFTNISKTNLDLTSKIKICFGLFLLIFFKKGYRFFDLKELKLVK
jgi:glycosyltransferase involved in cell wall biosynthesis